MPQPEPIAYSCCNRDNILQCATQLHPNYIVICVHTKSRVAEFALHGFHQRRVFRSDCDRSGISPSDFLGKRWPAQCADTGLEFTAAGDYFEITSVMRNRVFSSKPLVALTNMILGCKCVRLCSNKRLQCWEGITLTTISAPCSASSRLPVTNTQSGMEWPGRKSSLTRREEMESRTSFSKAHRRTRS